MSRTVVVLLAASAIVALALAFWWTSGLAVVAARRSLSCPLPPGVAQPVVATPTDQANLRLGDDGLRGTTTPEVTVCVTTSDTLWILSDTGCEWTPLPTEQRQVLTPPDRSGHGVRVRGSCGAWRVPQDGRVRVPRDWSTFDIDLSSGRTVRSVTTTLSVGGVIDVSREVWPAPEPVDPERVAAAERDENEGLLPLGWTVDNLTHAW